MTIEEGRISFQTWLDAWYWYRNAPHQVDAVNLLFEAIWKSDPALLHENAEWFQRYRDRDKLVHSAMFPDGQ
jgi:hypothetical protein